MRRRGALMLMLAAARAWHRCQGPLRTAVRARASKGDDLDEIDI